MRLNYKKGFHADFELEFLIGQGIIACIQPLKQGLVVCICGGFFFHLFWLQSGASIWRLRDKGKTGGGVGVEVLQVSKSAQRWNFKIIDSLLALFSQLIGVD